MFETEIRRGATLLDEKWPGWREGVDVNTLNMWSMDLCVLAQLFGDWTEGIHALGIKWDIPKQIEYGFDLREGPGYSDRCRTLTAEWKAYLRGEWS